MQVNDRGVAGPRTQTLPRGRFLGHSLERHLRDSPGARDHSSLEFDYRLNHCQIACGLSAGPEPASSLSCST